MQQYAKILSPTSITTAVPKSARIDGRFVIGRLPESYLNSVGFYRFTPVPFPSEYPSQGYHWEARYSLDSNDSEVVQAWVQVEDPPPPTRSLSKRKLYRALSEAGIWDAVREYMEENGVWEDWEFATTLDEDDPLILAAVQAIQAGLGLTGEQVSGIIEVSVAS